MGHPYRRSIRPISNINVTIPGHLLPLRPSPWIAYRPPAGINDLTYAEQVPSITIKKRDKTRRVPQKAYPDANYKKKKVAASIYLLGPHHLFGQFSASGRPKTTLVQGFAYLLDTL